MSVEDYVKQSTRASGVPVKVKDRDVLAKIASML